MSNVFFPVEIDLVKFLPFFVPIFFLHIVKVDSRKIITQFLPQVLFVTITIHIPSGNKANPMTDDLVQTETGHHGELANQTISVHRILMSTFKTIL